MRTHLLTWAAVTLIASAPGFAVALDQLEAFFSQDFINRNVALDIGELGLVAAGTRRTAGFGTATTAAGAPVGCLGSVGHELAPFETDNILSFRAEISAGGHAPSAHYDSGNDTSTQLIISTEVS